MAFRTCSHIKTDGSVCKSPALRRQSLCYFHHRWAKRAARMDAIGGPISPANNTGIELPLLEDHASIQLAIMEVMRALVDCRIDHKRASLLLYSLQLATINAQRLRFSGLSHTECVTEDPEELPTPKSAQSSPLSSPKRLGNARAADSPHSRAGLNSRITLNDQPDPAIVHQAIDAQPQPEAPNASRTKPIPSRLATTANIDDRLHQATHGNLNAFRELLRTTDLIP